MMPFHLEFPLEPLRPPVAYGQRFLLLGSCFAEQVGERMRTHLFDAMINPHGILYNPISIARAVEDYVNQAICRPEDLFTHEGLWHSWDHHGRFSSPDKEACLEGINRALREGAERLREADWLVLTLGSAQVFRLRDSGRTVANCHRMPSALFDRVMLRPEEVIAALDNMMHRVFSLNSRINILFTVSPVRYLREGVVRSGLSKAVLLYAIHHLVEKFDRLHYFPAYELVLDDLRDYRFFAADLVHPNAFAVDYVWEKFIASAMDDAGQEILRQVADVVRAAAHRPLHPQTAGYRAFREAQRERIHMLQRRYDMLDFSPLLQRLESAP